MKIKFALLGLIAMALGSFPIKAQPALTDQVKIEAKRAEFAKIEEDLASTDAKMRLAVIQTVVESRDPVKIDFALKIALASEDPAVRAVALRAYMATKKELIFAVTSPPAIQKRIDAALNGEPSELDELVKQYPYLSFTGTQAGLGIALQNYDMSKMTGAATANGNESSFSVTGDKVTGYGRWIFKNGTPCGYDFQPQKVLKDGPVVLRGSLACTPPCCGVNVTFPRLTITAPMF